MSLYPPIHRVKVDCKTGYFVYLLVHNNFCSRTRICSVALCSFYCWNVRLSSCTCWTEILSTALTLQHIRPDPELNWAPFYLWTDALPLSQHSYNSQTDHESAYNLLSSSEVLIMKVFDSIDMRPCINH